MKEVSDANRSKQYKNAGKSEDLRRRRIETSVELRRQRRDNEMMKRRNITTDEKGSDSDDASTDTEDRIKSDTQLSLSDVNAALNNNPDIETIRKLFELVRRSLSRSNEAAPLGEVISSGLLAKVIKGFEIQDEKVLFEAAWIVTNVASGTSEQTAAVVNAGAIKPLIGLCCSGSIKLAEQGMWALANIAGDSAQTRDLLIANDIIPVLFNLCDSDLSSYPKAFLQTLTWLFSNLCRHKTPQVVPEILKKITPALAILLNHDDSSVQQDACWALSYITDGPDENIVLALPSLSRVFKFLSSGNDLLISPSLRVLGNFTTGNDELTQAVINTGILNLLPTLISTKNSIIEKECLWITSNILAGTNEQIQSVIDADILPFIFNVLKAGEFRPQFEATWAIANLAHGGTANQILEIIRIKGSIEIICQGLTIKNNEYVINMLETLYALLSTVEKNDPENLVFVKTSIEDCDGLDKIDALQNSESEKVYISAYKIIDEFFQDEDMGIVEGEEVIPIQDTHFNF